MRPRVGLILMAAIAILALITTSALATSSAAGAVFLARAPGGGFECVMGDSPGPAFDQRVLCISNGRAGAAHQLLMQEVTLSPDGGVGTCIQRGLVNKAGCNFGNPDENTPTYRPGKVVTVGRFRCQVLHRSIKCMVVATGKGFRLTTQKVTLVGGAVPGPPPPSPLATMKAPSPQTNALDRARASSACSNQTVNQVGPAGRTTLRFVLIGHVSCAKAHQLIAAYFHGAASGRRCEGVSCIIQFRGGWTCSYFSATESAETGGTLAGCYQSSTHARVRVYPVLQGSGSSRPTVRSGAPRAIRRPGPFLKLAASPPD